MSAFSPLNISVSIFTNNLAPLPFLGQDSAHPWQIIAVFVRHLKNWLGGGRWRAGFPSDATNEIKRKETVREGRWLSCHEVTCGKDIIRKYKGKQKRAKGWCCWTWYAYLPHATEIWFYCFYLHGRNFSAGRKDYICCPPAFDNMWLVGKPITNQSIPCVHLSFPIILFFPGAIWKALHTWSQDLYHCNASHLPRLSDDD